MAGAPGSTATTDAFRELFAEHASYVWNLLRRFRVREADLADLTHEVFVVLYRQLEAASFDLERPVRPWLGATAFRVASTHGRSAAARREILSDEAGTLVADPGGGPEIGAAAAEDRALVLLALDQLDEERRAVLVLHDIEEEPVPAIADALGIPLNTAYSRLRLARADFGAAVRRLRPERARVFHAGVAGDLRRPA